MLFVISVGKILRVLGGINNIMVTIGIELKAMLLMEHQDNIHYLYNQGGDSLLYVINMKALDPKLIIGYEKIVLKIIYNNKYFHGLFDFIIILKFCDLNKF